MKIITLASYDLKGLPTNTNIGENDFNNNNNVEYEKYDSDTYIIVVNETQETVKTTSSSLDFILAFVGILLLIASAVPFVYSEMDLISLENNEILQDQEEMILEMILTMRKMAITMSSLSLLLLLPNIFGNAVVTRILIAILVFYIFTRNERIYNNRLRSSYKLCNQLFKIFFGTILTQLVFFYILGFIFAVLNFIYQLAIYAIVLAIFVALIFGTYSYIQNRALINEQGGLINFLLVTFFNKVKEAFSKSFSEQLNIGDFISDKRNMFENNDFQKLSSMKEVTDFIARTRHMNNLEKLENIGILSKNTSSADIRERKNIFADTEVLDQSSEQQKDNEDNFFGDDKDNI